LQGHGAAVVEVGQDEIRHGEGERAVEHAAELGSVEIEAAVAGGFGQRPKSGHGEEMVAAAAFGPHAIAEHAFFQLRTVTGGAVNRGGDEFGVVEEEADEADGAVPPALDVVDAVMGGQDDFVERRQEQFVREETTIVLAEGGPDEVGTLGDGDQPGGFGEGLGGKQESPESRDWVQREGSLVIGGCR
jgi:hypothetical protein